jgi:hypothetical protein
VLGGCLGVGRLSVCWVVVCVLGGCLCVGWLFVCWVVVWVLCGCLGVGWSSMCWLVVCVLGGCLCVGWLSVCWVVVWVLGWVVWAKVLKLNVGRGRVNIQKFALTCNTLGQSRPWKIDVDSSASSGVTPGI